MNGRDDAFWELALATNAAVKGLLGSMGESGHICASTTPVAQYLELDAGWDVVSGAICAAVRAAAPAPGDVIVVAEKIIAAGEGRVGPIELLQAPDPKTVRYDRLAELASYWERRLGFSVAPLHLLLADEYGVDRATVGALDHNAAAADLARRLEQELGLMLDVIISDTDTGLDTRAPLIGCITIGATPVGATAGLNLYEAMRCAVAAEFTRGHRRQVPVVICHPAQRRRNRPRIGEHRGYAGALHADRESGLTYC